MKKRRWVRYVNMIGIVAFFILCTVRIGICDTGKIKVGISLALTGPYGEMGRTFAEGWKVGFKRINDEGGINGKEVEWEIMDDRFTPRKAVENTKYLIEKWGADVLAGYCCPSIVNTVVDYLEREGKRIPFLFPMDGAKFIKETMKDCLYSIDPFYEDEVRLLLDYFLPTKQGYSWAIVYKSDPSLIVLRDMLEKDLACFGAKSILVDIESKNAIEQLVEFSPDVIVLVSDARSGYSFIGKLVKHVASHRMPNVVAMSLVFPCSYIRKISEIMPGGKFFFMQTTPHPMDKTYRLIREYLEDMKRYSSEKPCFISLRGYIGARLLGEMLKKTGGDPSVNSLVSAAESISWDLGIGKKFRFSSVVHRSPVGVGLFVVKDKGPKIECLLWDDFSHRGSKAGNVIIVSKKEGQSKIEYEVSKIGKEKRNVPIEVKIKRVTEVRKKENR